jgi:hypothetical protein
VGLADLLTADGREGLLASAVVAASAVAYYWLAVRKSGRWANRGPSASS